MTTWAEFSGNGQVQAAYDILRDHFTGPDAHPDLREWWAVLDDAASRATLPAQWERLTGVDVAKWLGMTHNNWHTKVATGYAPSPDGRDGAGRPWWHPTTIEAFRANQWKPSSEELARRPLATGRPAGTPPPTSGVGSGTAAWRAFLTAAGIEVKPTARHGDMVDLARKHGLLRSA